MCARLALPGGWQPVQPRLAVLGYSDIASLGLRRIAGLQRAIRYCERLFEAINLGRGEKQGQQQEHQKIS
jgi:hypothetical protein